MRGVLFLLVATTCLGASTAQASFINYSSREINVKIVYYGPATAGLAESLQYIYNRTNPKAKGKLISLATETERTLFFDFVPLSLGEIRGFKVRFHLYTVPGNTLYNASRLLILKGVDGVVFVADANPARAEANIESWKNLHSNLTKLGYRLETIPIVVQLDSARTAAPMSPERLKSVHKLSNQPVIPANSRTGAGLFDALKAVAKGVLTAIKRGVDRPVSPKR